MGSCIQNDSDIESLSNVAVRDFNFILNLLLIAFFVCYFFIPA